MWREVLAWVWSGILTSVAARAQGAVARHRGYRHIELRKVLVGGQWGRQWVLAQELFHVGRGVIVVNVVASQVVV